MNPEAFGVIRRHLRTANENLDRLALWPKESKQAKQHKVVCDSINEAYRLLRKLEHQLSRENT
jgi:hypothetical protein